MSNRGPKELVTGLWIPVAGTVVAFASGAVVGPTRVALVFSRKWYAAEHYFQALLPLLLVVAFFIYVEQPRRVWLRLVVGTAAGHAASLAAFFISASLVGRGALAIKDLLEEPTTVLLIGVLMGWFYGLCISAFTSFAADGKRVALLFWVTFVAGGLVGIASLDPQEMLKVLIPFVRC
jgi:hypothetical protein